MDSSVCQTQLKCPSYILSSVDKLVSMEEFSRECVKVFLVSLLCVECKNYGCRWTCPPFKFAHAQVWREYKSIWLFGRILTPEHGADIPTMLAAMDQEKNTLLEYLLELEAAHPGSQALSAGCCTLCEESCTRSDKRPCRHQDKMRYSIEALGGDVSRASEKYLGTSLLWIKGGQLPEYLTLVGGLLLKEAKPAR